MILKELVEMARGMREGDPCPACHGTGGSKKLKKIPCDTCLGRGAIPAEEMEDDMFDGEEQDPSITEYVCDACDGTGNLVRRDYCPECNGTGVWAPG